ncbi:hypothetical protein GCM10009785_24200 [Brooklawnia cerclae]
MFGANVGITEMMTKEHHENPPPSSQLLRIRNPCDPACCRPDPGRRAELCIDERTSEGTAALAAISVIEITARDDWPIGNRL